MKPTLLALPIAVGAMFLQPLAASAQTNSNCGERARVLNQLAERYGESRQAIGLGANNAVMEVFASHDTGTWTITVTLPNGLTCLVASGQAYEAINEELQPTRGEAL